MSVAFDSTNAAGVSGTNSVSSRDIFNVALSGSNRHMVIGVSQKTDLSVAVSSVARGADTYTVHAAQDGDTGGSVRVRNSMVISTNEPQTASATLTVTVASAETNWGFSYHSFTGVDQTTRMGAAVTDNGRATGTSLPSISSAVGDMVVCTCAVRGSGGTVSSNGGGQVNDWSFSTGTAASSISGRGDHKNGAASVSVGYTWPSLTQYAAIAANIIAAAVGITITPPPAVTTKTCVGPQVVLGAISITPPPAVTTKTSVGPQVVLGAISITPPPAVTTKTCTLGSVLSGITVQPPPAVTVKTCVGPQVVLGAISITPPPAVTTKTAVIGGVTVIGPLNITPPPAVTVKTCRLAGVGTFVFGCRGVLSAETVTFGTISGETVAFPKIEQEVLNI